MDTTILLSHEEKMEVVLEHMRKKNSPNYNLLKMAEECSELSTAILQRINKPGQVTDDEEIIDELGDVALRLLHFGNDERVAARVRHKINRYYDLINKGMENI